jgi:hypothetical protein
MNDRKRRTWDVKPRSYNTVVSVAAGFSHLAVGRWVYIKLSVSALSTVIVREQCFATVCVRTESRNGRRASHLWACLWQHRGGGGAALLPRQFSAVVSCAQANICQHWLSPTRDSLLLRTGLHHCLSEHLISRSAGLALLKYICVFSNLCQCFRKNY